MAINSRTKGANFEREIGNLLQEKLSLTNPVKRILEQTRTKELPDLKMGRWCIECKRYGPGSDPLDEWWDQVISSSGPSGLPALIYKFNRKPIKVRLLGESISDELIGSGILNYLTSHHHGGTVYHYFDTDLEYSFNSLTKVLIRFSESSFALKYSLLDHNEPKV